MLVKDKHTQCYDEITIFGGLIANFFFQIPNKLTINIFTCRRFVIKKATFVAFLTFR